jgi:hypothetical protein
MLAGDDRSVDQQHEPAAPTLSLADAVCFGHVGQRERLPD